MATQRTNLTTPVGRIVMGSLYKAFDKDAEGKPLVFKTGMNIGQPRVQFFFGLAIPKGQESHWAQTPWGAEIWRVGHTAFPQAAQSAAFAWKIEDGDSVIPNKRGKKPADQEGFKGHWILKFTGGYSPKVYVEQNGSYVLESTVDYVKPGHFVQVSATIDGNGSQSQPGIYLNHQMVAFRAYGAEISFGPDVNEAGFGAAPLPAGATLTPAASAVPIPATPGVSAVAPIPAPVAAPIPTVPAVPVMPNPGFLAVPAGTAAANPTQGIPAIPASIAATPPPPPPAAQVPASPSSGPQMTAKAAGMSYASFIAQGWTEATLVQHGYMRV